MKLTLKDLSPYLRYIHYIELVPEFTTHLQIAYDNRFFFCVKGDYEITVDKVQYKLKQNSLLFVPTGIPYHLNKPQSDVLLIGINFDFTHLHSDLSLPVPPALKKENFIPENIIEACCFENIEELNEPFILHDGQQLLYIIQTALAEYTDKRLFFSEKNSALLKELIISSVRILKTGYFSENTDTVDRIISFIQSNYHKKITNTDIGRELNFNSIYLNRLMLKHTGKTIHQYLLNVRLLKALDLLQNTNNRVGDIALTVGFGDAQELSKYFKKHIGSSPSDFR